MPETTKDNVKFTAQAHPGFRFVVDIDGKPAGAFTECTLPTLEWEIEVVKEGGLNGYVHQLPGRRKSAKLTLKNGVGTSVLLKWYLTMLEAGGVMDQFERRSVTVSMLDSHLAPVMRWHMEEAYPMKWSGPSLKTDDNSIAIQTLELVCNAISIEVGD